ncbi:MAG: hypothetical protein KBE27_04920 [Syntrophorhabdaceae bacterium]|nr:hypothetical protein [Syntrophorhabdales bacterium]MBP9561141.1 hypothetical protein [Syntrophorhabdaceae bacterium]
MVTKTARSGVKSPEQRIRDKSEKQFKDALASVEKIAKERLQSAKDPFSIGLRMASQLRTLAASIESEIDDQSITMTEASYVSNGMLGVGV